MKYALKMYLIPSKNDTNVHHCKVSRLLLDVGGLKFMLEGHSES